MSKVEQKTKPHVVVATRNGVKIVPSKKRDTHLRVLEEPDDILREQVGGFTNFIKEYAVVGLAIGFVVGQQANAVAKQLVTSFIEPWLQVIFGTDLGKRAATAHHGHEAEAITFAWGAFVYVFIEFIFVAITIYLVVKLLRLDKLKKPKEEKKK